MNGKVNTPAEPRLGRARQILHRIRRNATQVGLEEQLAELERQADGEAEGFEALYYNRAGDLCLADGQLPRALGYYGRAIDAYLRAGRLEAAGAVCQKLLRVSPASIRARSTLVWIAIARSFTQQAGEMVGDYVTAAHSAGKTFFAIRHLVRMTHVVADAGLLRQIGLGLRALDAEDTARRAFDRALAVQGGTLQDVGEARRRQAAVKAALLGPGELAMETAA